MTSRLAVLVGGVLLAGFAAPAGAQDLPPDLTLDELHKLHLVEDLPHDELLPRHLWFGEFSQMLVEEEILRHSEGFSAGVREIFSVQVGDGPARVLVASQLDGLASDGTRALADLVQYLVRGEHADAVRLASEVTLTALFFVNPDGVVFERSTNLLAVDLELDGRRRATIEGGIFGDAVVTTDPGFSVILGGLAPEGRVVAADPGSAAPLACMMLGPEPLVRGTEDPRRWEVSLAEQGLTVLTLHPEASERVRAVTFGNLLGLLEHAAGREPDACAPSFDALPALPPSGDVLVVGGTLHLPDGHHILGDVLLGQDGRRTRLLGLGDLEGTQASDTLDARGRIVRISEPSVPIEPGAEAVQARVYGSLRLTSRVAAAVQGGQLHRSASEFHQRRTGLFVRLSVARTPVGASALAHGLAREMVAEGWNHEIAGPHPWVESPRLVGRVGLGYNLSGSWTVEVSLQGGGDEVVQGASLIEEDVRQFVVRTSSAALLVGRRTPWFAAQLGPALLWPEWSSVNSLAHPTRRRAPDRSVWRTFVDVGPGDAQTTVTGVAFDLSRPLASFPMYTTVELRVSGWWAPSVQVPNQQRFPAVELPLSQVHVGLSLVFAP